MAVNTFYLPDHTIKPTTMNDQIENIKIHFATKSDVMKWTMSVGAATVLAVISVISGMLFIFDARFQHVHEDIREVKRDVHEIRKETQQAIAEIRAEQKEVRQILTEIGQAITEMRAEQKATRQTKTTAVLDSSEPE